MSYVYRRPFDAAQQQNADIARGLLADLSEKSKLTFTGDIASTLDGVTSAATATLIFSGDVADTLAGVTCSAAGTVAFIGDITTTLVGVTMSGAGTMIFNGDIATTLAGVTSDIQADNPEAVAGRRSIAYMVGDGL
jgi:hypothetical protein